MTCLVKAKPPLPGQSEDPLIKRLAPRGFQLDKEYSCIAVIPNNVGSSKPYLYLVLVNDNQEMKIEASTDWIYSRKSGKIAEKEEVKK